MPLKPAAEVEREKPESSGVAEAGLTYINLTENNVYYAANHNQGVEHVPGIPEISLSEGERVVGESNAISAKRTKRLHSHTEILNQLTAYLRTHRNPC